MKLRIRIFKRSGSWCYRLEGLYTFESSCPSWKQQRAANEFVTYLNNKEKSKCMKEKAAACVPASGPAR